jgi:hypothetical protein
LAAAVDNSLRLLQVVEVVSRDRMPALHRPFKHFTGIDETEFFIANGHTHPPVVFLLATVVEAFEISAQGNIQRQLTCWAIQKYYAVLVTSRNHAILL